MANPQEAVTVCEAFVRAFYDLFNRDRPSICSFYVRGRARDVPMALSLG